MSSCTARSRQEVSGLCWMRCPRQESRCLQRNREVQHTQCTNLKHTVPMQDTTGLHGCLAVHKAEPALGLCSPVTQARARLPALLLLSVTLQSTPDLCLSPFSCSYSSFPLTTWCPRAPLGYNLQKLCASFFLCFCSGRFLGYRLRMVCWSFKLCSQSSHTSSACPFCPHNCYKSSHGDYAECVNAATGFQAENTPKELRMNNKKKLIPETLMYFPVCFPF